MAAVIEGGGSRGHKGGKKKSRRLGVRLDMTPMVDVAFLLLTFFMLSTTLTQPQVMEINLPPESKVTVDVAASNLLTLRVNQDQAVFWNVGLDAPKRAQYSEVGKILEQNLRQNPKIATLIKIDRRAKYQTLVSMIDELNLTNARLGNTEKRFSIVTMDEADQLAVAAL